MRIAIIGAGITGLTAAYRLSQKSHQVTIFEKENYVGGLAAGFKKKGWNWHPENFFHHLFSSDQAAKNLITKLELSGKLFYVHPKTSIFKNGQIFQFDSPFSVLTFPHLSSSDKLKTGLVTSYLKSTSSWQKLEKTTAQGWLKKYYGQKTYQILWQPLLIAKFGNQTPNISMAWFWARIKKRSAKLGYLEGGFQVLIDKLVKKIKEKGGQVVLNSEIKHFNYLNNQRRFDRIIFTVPTSVFLKIMGSRLPKAYQKRVQKLRMIGTLNLILILKEKFLTGGTYWLNINEPGFPFVAVVEHTNFVNPKYYGGNHILYVGGYYSQNHRYFKMKKEKIFKEFLPYLKKINPRFNLVSRSPLRGIPSECTYHVSRNLFAQPIIPTNYSKMIPKMKTPVPNVYLANMQMVYPWDRGINYAIELGEKIADAI